MADKMPWDDLPQDTNQTFPWDDLPEDEEEEVIVAEEKPFSADQYYDPPGFAATMGLSGSRLNKFIRTSPVGQDVSQTEEFQSASDRDKRVLLQKAVDEANQKIYEQQGEEGLFGIRTQKTTDEDGNPQTYVVPAPGSKGVDMLLGKTGGRIARNVAGGALEAAKAVGQSAEYVADRTPILRNFTGPDTAYIKENFPTLPPEGDIDNTVQEVTSILLGAASGAGLVQSLIKGSKLTPKAAKFIAKQWSKRSRKGKSPADLGTAANTLVTSVLTGTGANIGATVTAPDRTVPLFGDEVVEVFGLDPEENQNLAVFADNVAFSGIINALGKTAKAAYGKGKKVFKGAGALFKNSRDMDIGMLVVAELDPNLVGLPAPVLADRLKILADVLDKNKIFEADALAGTNVPLTTTTALRNGVQEYVDTAYSLQKSLMSDADWKQFSGKLAGDMVSKMVDLRQTQVSSGSVRTAETNFLSGMQQALADTAEELGGAPAVQSSADELANPIVADLGAAQADVMGSQATVDTLLQDLTTLRSNNEIADRLVQAQRQGDVFGDTPAEQARLQNLTGPQLYAEWKSSQSMYNDAFNNLPYKPLDVPKFTELVREASTALDSIEQVTLANQVKSTPFDNLVKLARGYAKDGSLDATDARLIAENLSFTDVYTEIRPLLEARIKQLATKGDPFTAVKKLKDGIDEMAAEIDDEQFKEAMNLWKKHQNTWRSTAPLKEYDTVARRAVPDIGVGVQETYTAGMRALEQAAGDIDYNPEYIRSFIRAMQESAFDDQNIPVELSEAWVGQAMNALAFNRAKAGASTVEGPSSAEILEAVDPFIKRLRVVSPDVVDRFNSVIQDLQGAESGLVSAELALARVQKVADEVLRNAEAKAASAFVYDIAGKQSGPAVTQTPQEAFKRIFNNAQAPNYLPELLEAARNSPNGDLAVRGMKSAFIANLMENLRISKAVGTKPGDPTSTVRSISAARVASILEDPSSPTLKSLFTIFEDEPERAGQLFRLLEIHDMAAGGRSIRGETFGSTTTYDQDLKKLMDRAVTLQFGVLNTRATIIRNLGDAVTKDMREKVAEAARVTMANIASDPEEFSRILTLLSQNQEESALDIMRKLTARGFYTAMGQDDPIDQQMMDLVPQ